MYICIYVCMYVCVHLYCMFIVYMCIFIYMHVYVIYVRVYVVCMYVCMYLCILLLTSLVVVFAQVVSEFSQLVDDDLVAVCEVLHFQCLGHALDHLSLDSSDGHPRPIRTRSGSSRRRRRMYGCLRW